MARAQQVEEPYRIFRDPAIISIAIGATIIIGWAYDVGTMSDAGRDFLAIGVALLVMVSVAAVCGGASLLFHFCSAQSRKGAITGCAAAAGGMMMIALTHHENRQEAMDALVTSRTTLVLRIPGGGKDGGPPPVAPLMSVVDMNTLRQTYDVIGAYLLAEKQQDEGVTKSGSKARSPLLSAGTEGMSGFEKMKEVLEATRRTNEDRANAELAAYEQLGHDLEALPDCAAKQTALSAYHDKFPALEKLEKENLACSSKMIDATEALEQFVDQAHGRYRVRLGQMEFLNDNDKRMYNDLQQDVAEATIKMFGQSTQLPVVRAEAGRALVNPSQ